MTLQFDFKVNRGNLWEGGIPYVPSSAYDAGKLVQEGYLNGFTKRPLVASANEDIHQEGLWEGKKKSTVDTFAVGDLVYWDFTNLYCSKTPSPLLLGICTKDASATDLFVIFKKIDFPFASPLLATPEDIFEKGDFTDNGDATGYIDLTTGLIPAKSLVLGHEVKILTGFVGDTTAVYQVGDSSDLDRFSADVDGSVLADGAIVGSATKVHAFCPSAVTPRLTITGASDFGLITAGKGQIRFFYIPLSSLPVPTS